MPADDARSGPALPAWPWHLVAPAVLGLVLFLVYGGGYVGIDGMWSIVWGRDLVHGATLAYSGTTTPHVLTNLVGAALTPLGGDADHGLVALTFLAAGSVVWTSALLARDLAGIAAGIAAGLFVITRESLLYTTTSAFLDVFIAAFVSWAALLVVRRGVERPVLPCAVLLTAGLLRPEAWVLAGAYWLWRVRRGHGPALWQLAAVVAAPASWLLVDAVFAGDALSSVHATQRVTDLVRAGGRIPDTLLHRLTDAPKSIVHAAGIELFLVALPAAAVALWPRAAALPGLRLAAQADRAHDRLRILLWGGLVYSGVLLLEALAGGLVFTRFAVPMVGGFAVLVAVTGSRVAERLRARRAAAFAGRAFAGAAVVLLLLQLPFLVSARSTTGREHDRYDAARAAIRPGLPCLPAVTPNTNFRVYVAGWADLRGDQVVDGAAAAPPRVGTFVTAVTPPAIRTLRDPVFPQRAAFAPAPVVRATGGFLITARCAR